MRKMIKTFAGDFPAGKAVRLADMVEYGTGAIVSRVLAKGAGGNMTLFAFDEGQELSEHTAPFDAWVQVEEGEMTVTIDGKPQTVLAGQGILMPAGIPHALVAEKKSVMVLFMIRVG